MSRIVLAAAFASIALFSYANRAQVWTQANVSYAIASNINFNVSQENRWGTSDLDGSKHIDEIHVAPGFMLKMYDWLSFGPNYRLVILRDGSDARWKLDSRPGFDVQLSKTYEAVKFINRSRFICRQVEHEHAYFRYRNLSKVVLPAIAFLELKPYASYEWYFDEGCKERRFRKNDKFSTQWISFGLSKAVSKNMELDLFYMLTETKDRHSHAWCPGHVIGLNLTFCF
jgi:hypothetical protein